jgi:hypothetical protein
MGTQTARTLTTVVVAVQEVLSRLRVLSLPPHRLLTRRMIIQHMTGVQQRGVQLQLARIQRRTMTEVC